MLSHEPINPALVRICLAGRLPCSAADVEAARVLWVVKTSVFIFAYAIHVFIHLRSVSALAAWYSLD